MKNSIFKQSLVIAILIVLAIGMYSSIDATSATNDLSVPSGEDETISPNCCPAPGWIKIIKTIDSEGGQPQSGVAFKLYDGNNRYLKEAKTDRNGIIVFGGLAPGKYKIEEIVPSGYTSNLINKKEVNVCSNRETLVKVVNTLIRGGLKVIKTLDSESGSPGVNITFKLSREDKVYTKTTDSNGIALFTALVPGKYYLEEETPAGYVSSIDKQEINILGNKTVEYKVINTKVGNIEVVKRLGSDSGQFQPGITFKLYQGGKLIATKVTDNNGKAKFEKIPVGNYILKEEVPEGYTSSIGDGVEVTVEHNKTTPLVVINTPKVGSIEVTKRLGSSDGQLQSGITFKLYQGSKLIDTKVTGSGGKVRFENLAVGSYTLKEDIPEGYTSSIGDGIVLTVEYNKTTPITVVNNPLKGELIVLKTIDSISGQPQEGVEFELYKGSTLISKLTTDNFGKVQFTNLATGKYQLKENVPPGYVSSINGTVDVEIIGGQTNTIRVINSEKIGQITVVKKDQNGDPMKNITFNLYKKISDNETANPIIATGTTNDQGITIFGDLVPGEYFIEEEVPEGYKSSIGGMKLVTVKPGETSTVNIINILITADIEIFKTINTVDGDPQEGVTFELYKEDKLVETGKTGSSGYLIFDKLIPGEYQLKEIVPNGYESNIDGTIDILAEGDTTSSVFVVNSKIINIEDPKKPSGPSKLPQTGGTPATLFYIGGLILAVLGMAMRKKED